jgi:hypothetical protein
MGYFVILDENNFVIKVDTINNSVFTMNNIENVDKANDFLNNLFNTNNVYLQTSYNTRGGVHYTNGIPSQDQSKSFRKNYAGIGYYYDSIRDAFIPPKPYPSWTLNEQSCLWQSPIPYPNTSNIPEPYIWYNRYFWNEDTINWELMKPFNSWLLNQDNYYTSPIPYPSDGNKYYWNEETQQWNIYN